MTFILNILHKEFSVLVADKQGNSTGSAVINRGAGTIRINSPKIVINGVKKVFLNRQQTLAVGIAGTVVDHQYGAAIEDLDSNEETLGIIHRHVAEAFIGADRRAFHAGNPIMENEGIATYFDPILGDFFSNLYAFTPQHYGGAMYHASRGNQLVHVGSGSPALEGAVGVDSINDFLKSLQDGVKPEACLDWVAHAYKKVSEVAPGCGSNFVAYAATKASPKFVEIAST